MRKKHKKRVVDTNVPILANQAAFPNELAVELLHCANECVSTIEDIVKNGGLVIDSKDEIFDEYRNHLSLKGQPGMGDVFLKWVHDKRWSFPDSDRVEITKTDDGYEEFPEYPGLEDFDPSDKKFVAVSNAHPEKPVIYQAVDTKWWGWKNALLEVGIEVKFLDPEYIEAKFNEMTGR